MTLEIFVPFWGDPALLYETVDSVRAQRNPDWRLIVIDDCYPDDSVPAYFAALDDERITLHAQRGQPRHHRELPRGDPPGDDRAHHDPRLRRSAASRLRRRDPAHDRRTCPHADVIQPGVAGDRRARRPGAARWPIASSRACSRRAAATASRCSTRRADGDEPHPRRLAVLAVARRSAPRRSSASTSARACRSSRTSPC